MRSGPQRRRLRRCATLLANLPSALRICGHWTSTRRLHTKPPCVGTGTPTWRPSDAICELVGTRPCGFVEVRPDGGHHYCAHTGLFRVACGSERLALISAGVTAICVKYEERVLAWSWTAAYFSCGLAAAYFLWRFLRRAESLFEPALTSYTGE